MASSASIEKIKAIQKGLGLQNISGQWNKVDDIEFSSLLENLISWKKKFGENISIPNWILNTPEGRYPELKFRGNLNQALELVENKEKYYKEFLRLKEPSAEQRDNFVYTLFLLYIQKILNQKTTGVLSDELHKKYPNSTTSTGLKDIIKDLSSNDQFKKLDLIKNKLGVTGNLWDYETLFNLNKKINEVCQQEGFVKNIYGVNFCDTTIDVIDGLVQFKDDNEQTVGKEAVSFDSGNKFFNKTTAYRNKGVGKSMSMSNNKNVRNAGVRAAQLAEIAIISKVAARKERAKVNLIKMAQEITTNYVISVPGIDYKEDISEIFKILNYCEDMYGSILDKEENEYDSAAELLVDLHIFISNMITRFNADENNKMIIFEGDRKKILRLLSYIFDRAIDESSEFSDSDTKIHFHAAQEADKIIKLITEKTKNSTEKNIEYPNGSQPSTSKPNSTTNAPAQATATSKNKPKPKPNASAIITLLGEISPITKVKPGTGPTWDRQTNDSFIAAIELYCSNYNIKNCDTTKQWPEIASVLRFAPDMSGAEQMLKVLKETLNATKQLNELGQATTNTPSPTPTAPSEPNTTENLKKIFEKILNKTLKVDREGFDLRRDSHIFRGVIMGLGGSEKAAEYCVNKLTFDQTEQKDINIIANTQPSDAKQKFTSSALKKVADEFLNIKKAATKGLFNIAIGDDKLAKKVKEYLAGNKKTSSSISKAIEMRKLAARKRLGL